MRVRPYTHAELPRLLDAFSGWIERGGRCAYDHVGEVPHRIYENLRGDPDRVHLWEDGGEIVALALTMRFGEAFDLFVAPELAGSETEAELLEFAARTTAASGRPYVLTDVLDCSSSRIELLHRLGFERFRVWDHVNDRSLAEPVPEALLPYGFTVRQATGSDAWTLAEAHNSAFGSDWRGADYGRLILGRAQAPAVVAVDPEGRVGAFTVAWTDPRNGTGHFEPVGTHAGFRRLGLARAVMAHALAEMRAAGLRSASVNHNAENLPAAALYRGLGFQVAHETYGYRLKVS
ncbi:GNAT family N-acetyltransferase [Nonomuraea sp. NPDC050328]|uniref:GNAT family N-acetyltransferase n=1 Tax=Nonomuraea sp. NPDC050328 TaxID=3364361 RepID=UPI0037B54A24